jgi:hypothetical protein
MKHWAAGILAMWACVGCATMTSQPKLSSAQILPDNLKPGDTAVITVKLDDKFGVVKRVEGVVKEDRTIKFKFEDNGAIPDDEANDGIWTIQVDVPFNAPPGQFNFEVTAYDETGEVVVVDDKEGEAAPLTTSFMLDIQYPDESASPAAPAPAGATK